jgi:glycosyltransferase involved in cell wall biosynthesis
VRRAPPIDVVVVAQGESEALATCLAAVREHGGYRDLIVADEASCGERVRECRARGDVAVVPAESVVTPGWLDRLSACVASAADIASATPLTTMSIPAAAQADADTVATAAELAAVPLYPQIAAPGPVALLRGNGRTRPGFRHVVCDDAFVATRAGEGDAALAPIAAMVEAQLAVGARGDIPGVLHVVHPRGGGTEKFIRELIASRGDYRHYFLRIHDDRWRVTGESDAAPAFELSRGDADARPDWLRDLCAWLRIGLVHVHSMVGSGDDLVRMIRATALPYCYSVHDMYLPCPTVYLIDADGEYCNATTDAATCRRCLARFAGLPTDIERWRARYREFLAGAARVYAPSRWAGDTLLRYYPQAAVAIAPPHEEPVAPSAVADPARILPLPRDGRRAIGILGAIGPEKGARIVEALAARIRERALPLRLVVVGYTDTLSRFQSDDAVLTVHGDYAREEIEALLDAYGIELLLFPTVWPETFSYTLSEGWMASRPALVPPRGALAERVAATGAGWTIDNWPDVDAMLDQLVRITSPESRDDVAHIAASTRAVFRGEARAIAQPPDLYGDLVDEPRPLDRARASRHAIYESACRALGVAPLPPPKPAPEAEPARAMQRLLRMLKGW